MISSVSRYEQLVQLRETEVSYTLNNLARPGEDEHACVL